MEENPYKPPKSLPPVDSNTAEESPDEDVDDLPSLPSVIIGLAIALIGGIGFMLWSLWPHLVE